MMLEDCPVSVTLRYISGKWKPLILNELKTAALGFGQLQRKIPEASHKVLTEQLRQLQKAGIITRTTHKGPVQRSNYELSELGQTLRPALHEMAMWGTKARQRERASLRRQPKKQSTSELFHSAVGK